MEWNEQKIVDTWRMVHEPFVMPCPCLRHQWQHVDCDIAGCVRCGFVHVCGRGECPLIIESDSSVCEITGFCVRDLQFGDNEFVETVNLKAPEQPRSMVVDYDTVLDTVRGIIESPQTRQTICLERDKTVTKFRSVMQQEMRDFKRQNPGRMPNIPQVYTSCLNKQKNFRLFYPEITEAVRHRVIHRATQSIVYTMTLINQTNVRNLSKLKHQCFVTGMLYLMKKGVDIEGMVILPQMPELQHLLPSESHINTLFNMRCKTVTEIENIIKMFVRNTNTELFIRNGMFHAVRN